MPHKHTPNKSGAPVVRFNGIMVGPQGSTHSGDRNKAYNHDVICGCDAFIGNLAAFAPNAQGQRTPYCPICKHIIIISATGKVVHYAPHDITQTPPPKSS